MQKSPDGDNQRARDAARRWEEVEAFAYSPEFIRFCLAQTSFVRDGEGETFTRDSARHIGIEARRRRLRVTDILFAKNIGGCRRSASTEAHAEWSRYHACLRWVLAAFFEQPIEASDTRTDAAHSASSPH